MRQDAEEDPETFPNATYAKLMLDQVFDISCLNWTTFCRIYYLRTNFFIITCVWTYYLIEVLYYWNSLGRQEAGETDCHDISVWCYL